jgi:integrase
VNFEAKTLTIPLPKGKRTRRVPLSDEALTILRSLDLLTPFVFPDPMEPLKPRQGDLVADYFKRILIKTGRLLRRVMGSIGVQMGRLPIE